ncbi:MAG: hypothetical protein JXD22_10720, partial [Sedimentisphaerales bacterium]|nr:hypothetical protein [Sedimentisphaerales bacterium]
MLPMVYTLKKPYIGQIKLTLDLLGFLGMFSFRALCCAPCRFFIPDSWLRIVIRYSSLIRHSGF